MDELEAFKTQVNLSEYAAAQGYAIDRKESWRGSVVIRKRAFADIRGHLRAPTRRPFWAHAFFQHLLSS